VRGAMKAPRRKFLGAGAEVEGECGFAGDSGPIFPHAAAGNSKSTNAIQTQRAGGDSVDGTAGVAVRASSPRLCRLFFAC